MRLDGRIALATGAAMGVVEAFSRRLAREGAQVVLTDIVGGTGEAAAERISAEGGKTGPVRLDVASLDTWQAAIDPIGTPENIENSIPFLASGHSLFIRHGEPVADGERLSHR